MYVGGKILCWRDVWRWSEGEMNRGNMCFRVNDVFSLDELRVYMRLLRERKWIFLFEDTVVNLEYQCMSELGPPTPSPQASVSPPLDAKGGINTLSRVRGWGVPIPQFGRLDRKPGILYNLYESKDKAKLREIKYS
jgi:hypothetical protein